MVCSSFCRPTLRVLTEFLPSKWSKRWGFYHHVSLPLSLILMSWSLTWHRLRPVYNFNFTPPAFLPRWRCPSSPQPPPPPAQLRSLIQELQIQLAKCASKHEQELPKFMSLLWCRYVWRWNCKSPRNESYCSLSFVGVSTICEAPQHQWDHKP